MVKASHVAIAAVALGLSAQSCVGNIGDGGGVSEQTTEAESYAVASTAVRRLSRREVNNVLSDVFGLPDLADGLPVDVLSPFDTDADTKLPSAVFVDGHEALAETIATTVAADASAVEELAGCASSGPGDEACLRQLAERLGRRLWRRPLTEEEVGPLVASALDFATTENDFSIGAQLIIQSLMLSPDFIYITAIGEEEGKARRLTPHELVTRLSFLILGTAPDESLLSRADAGEISDEELAAMAGDLLDAFEAKAESQMLGFHTMWFSVQEPRVPAEYEDSARLETEQLLRRVLFQQQEAWTEIFLANETYTTSAHAEFVGLPAPDNGEGWVTYPDPNQSGVLSHMSWLSMGALIESETSHTKRGMRVVRGLLCRGIPDPPDDVDIDNVEVPETGCLSDFYAGHAQPGTLCQGCHVNFDPVGRGLENWDAYGRWRDTEPDRPECAIDGTGTLVGAGDFSGPRELAGLMIDSGELTTCLTKRYLEFASGRSATSEDDDVIERVHDRFSEADVTIRDLIIAHVTDPAFRFRKDVEACQ